MEFTSIPIIVIMCYLIGEIYKVCFKKKEELFKLIPIIVSIIGGIFGLLIYKTNPEIILNCNNVWTAIGIGLVSGATSTGANQIVKQMLFKEKESGDEDVY